MQSFADLGVSSTVVQALARDDVREPFAVQRLVIADILAGRDVLARSPTGSGKTLAFGIPMVDRIQADGPRPAALILAPTRELATQIATDIRSIAHARALSVTPVYGGVGLVKQAKLAARSHIIVATPGRLEDLLEREAFSLREIRMLVLDEADRMLDMGFRPAVDRIVRACPRARQTLFFSATLEGEAGTTAQRYTTDPVRHEHGPSAHRAAVDVEHKFISVSGEGRIEALIAELEAERDLALVFVRTKRGADRLVKRLGAHGLDAVAMHGNKSQRQREVALARFESGKVDTLVATDVAARGIDIDGISHVINFDPPADHESYVHRVGRTGRAGRTGVATTLVDGQERRDVGLLADHLGIEHGLGSFGGNAPSANRPPQRGGSGAGAPSKRRRAPRPGTGRTNDRVGPRDPRQDSGARADRPNGSSRSDRPNGSSRSDRPNGSSRSDRPNGSSRSDRPNGSSRSDRPNGSSRSDRPNGSSRSDRQNGNQRSDGPGSPHRRYRQRDAVGSPTS
jgi:ATP-dependent RNA helicase RhlE